MTGPHRTRLSSTIGRLLQALLVVWAASTATFVLLRAAPGDLYTTSLDGFSVPDSTRALWRAQRGLDQPLPAQYLLWVRNAARGDLGYSTMFKRPVRDVMRDVLPRTLLLMGLALATSMLCGMAIGAWQGTRAGSTGDRWISTLSMIAYSLPEFWLALLMLQIFVQWLGWFPATGIVDAMHDLMPPGEQLLDRLRHLALPWCTLSLVGTALFARFQRSSMIDAWREPHVRTARAKGLTERAVRRHAWRTALVPVITLFGLLFPALLGGAVFVERVFGWPGMGYTTILAVGARDYDLVTAAVIVGSAMTAVGSLLADGLLTIADPRTRAP